MAKSGTYPVFLAFVTGVPAESGTTTIHTDVIEAKDVVYGAARTLEKAGISRNSTCQHKISPLGSFGESRCSGNFPKSQGLQPCDPLIKGANQRVQADHSDALNVQQLELWPDAE